MQMMIHGLSFEVTDAIRAHVESRLLRSLGTASEQIQDVSVRLTDINGSHGGADKRCHITVRLRHSAVVTAEAMERDLYAAVDEASSRAKGRVWRQIKRRRTLRREYAGRDSRRLLA